MVDLIDHTSTNAHREQLHCSAKGNKNYTKNKVHSGDFVASDGSKYLPNSAMSDEDNDEDKKPKAKSKSSLRKEPGPPPPILHTVGDGNDEVDDDVEDVSII